MDFLSYFGGIFKDIHQTVECHIAVHAELVRPGEDK